MIKPVKTSCKNTSLSIRYNESEVIKYLGQSGTCGYAVAAKGYIADYILKDIPVSWEPLVYDNSLNDKNYYVDILAESVIDKKYDNYDKVIIHTTPDAWKHYIPKYSHIKNIIGYCTWETNLLSKHWVNCINELNEVWVPSSFNKQCFINSGVKSLIRIKPHVWHCQKLLEKNNVKIIDYCGNEVPNNKFTFYSIGEMNHRKGIEDLIYVFDKLKEKYKNIQLLLKLHYKKYDDGSRKYCLDKIRSITNNIGSSIYLIFNNLSRREIVSLHSFGDCYISLNKGEGFGLTIFDAYNFGKNIVTTGYGGQLDYLGSFHPGLVDYKLSFVDNMNEFNENYCNDQQWAHPNLDHAYELMKKNIVI